MRCCDLLHRQLVSVYGGDVVHSHLTSDNATLLRQLSPQGVAKLNSDASKGVPLECTLLELKAAYVRRSRRVDMLRCSLNDTTQRLLAAELHPNRPLTVNEVQLFADSTDPRRLVAEVHKLTEQGNSTEDALEHIAAAHALSLRLKQHDVVHNLVPTTLNLQEQRDQRQNEPAAVTKKLVCEIPNPTECWFLDNPKSTPLGDDFPACVLSTAIPMTATISPHDSAASKSSNTSCSQQLSPFKVPTATSLDQMTSFSSSSSSRGGSMSSDEFSGTDTTSAALSEVDPHSRPASASQPSDVVVALGPNNPCLTVRFVENSPKSSSMQPRRQHSSGKKPGSSSAVLTSKRTWLQKAAEWFKSLKRSL